MFKTLIFSTNSYAPLVGKFNRELNGTMNEATVTRHPSLPAPGAHRSSGSYLLLRITHASRCLYHRSSRTWRSRGEMKQTENTQPKYKSFSDCGTASSRRHDFKDYRTTRCLHWIFSEEKIYPFRVIVPHHSLWSCKLCPERFGGSNCEPGNDNI